MSLVCLNEYQHIRATVGKLNPQTTTVGLENPVISQILLQGRRLNLPFRPLKVGQPLIFLSAKFPQSSLLHLEMFSCLPAAPPLFFCSCSLVQPALTGGQIRDPLDKDLYFYHLPRPVNMMAERQTFKIHLCKSATRPSLSSAAPAASFRILDLLQIYQKSHRRK